MSQLRSFARVIALPLLLAFGAQARGEALVRARLIELERAHAKRLEHVGEWFTGVALAHMTVATVLLLIATIPSHECAPGRICGEGAGFVFYPTVGLFAAGGALLAAGAPLWAVGRARQRRLARATAFDVAPNGLSLRL
jgi:hypothetical protein